MKIAIIPARGGSKGLPRKSVLPVAGRPLIHWTIDAAIKSEQFDLVLVSTEDAEIASVAARFEDVKLIDRPPELATDEASTMDVVVHALEAVEANDDDVVALLQLTSPLRDADDIRKAMRLFLKGDHDSLISVTALDSKANWGMCLEDGSLQPLAPDASGRRQGLAELYVPNGAIYISMVKDLLRNDSFFGRSCAPYVMTAERSVDIDTAEDLREAERRMNPIPTVSIGDRKIGKGNPTYIIAEAGVNHNGDVELALKLVDVAAAAGADAVKFQTFKADRLVAKGAKKAEYQRNASDEDQLQMVKRLELRIEEFSRIHRRCLEKGIEFLSTPFDHGSLGDLVDMGMRAIKVPSGELNDLPFLGLVRDRGLPVILSTGMGSLEEVDRAVDVFTSANVPLILLQCTTSYPASFETLNLRVIQSMGERYNVPVGLSDHSPDLTAPITAVALGASLIEKHFTLDKAMDGPDHRASLDPVELKQMVEAIRNVERSLGDGVKRPFLQELEIAKVARRSVVATKDIPKGAVITREMLILKRPGIGIPPEEMDSVVGKKANRRIKADEVLKWRMLE
ncbi:MAG TPA: N-acetylneuraminate synthase [Methanomassiliicoccales archaeon]|nr:N-acetylneuraminate synthase [Methanomassiliicoccales archaeon]